MDEKLPLKHIVYHPTFNCNLSCRGCVNYSNHLETRKIPDETEWARDLDSLFKKFDVEFIEIAGGEPLMLPHLHDIIKKLAPAKRYAVTTNGLLLYKNLWLRDILENNPNFKIKVSMHHDPKIDSPYIDRFCDSLSKFLDIPSNKIKYHLSKHSRFGNAVVLKERFIVRDTYSRTSWSYPKLDNYELPILYDNDKDEAFKECICPWPHIKDGKIYKCPMTAMLLKVVEAKNLYNDNWKFLKDYVPYDLLGEHNEDNWNNLFKSEDVCKRCPVKPSEWDFRKIDLHSKIV